MMKRLFFVATALLATLPAFGATCKISEYRIIARDGQNRVVMIANEPAITTQSVTYTVTTQSSAFQDNTAFIRIICDAKAHFVFGTNPTATASSPYVAADTPEYFGLPQGNPEDYVVAFYDGSS